MFCDETMITVKAGKGGDGAIAFRREKFVAKGGPEGGDGGRGGSVILIANENINTLSDINSKKLYKASHGENGSKKNMAGKYGENLYLKVPVGTVIWDESKEKIIVDLSKHGQEFIIAKGGKGGLGNQHFVSSIHQAPTFAESGEPGEEKIITLELKLVADLGLVGMPSVGKSTLISVVSNARPKIAAYEFTTLIPNLGVVNMTRFGGAHSDAFVVADIPGLIEGAHAGKGLGIQFLKHVSRTSVLLHMIDPLREDPIGNFFKIQKELELFDKKLVKKPLIISINKIDSVSEKDLEKIEDELKKRLKKKTLKVYRISAVTGEGLKELLFEALKQIRSYKLKESKKATKQKEKLSLEVPILKPHEELVKFKIVKVKKTKKNKVFFVSGKRIEQLLNMTNIDNLEGLERIYHFLSKMGILKAVKRLGATHDDQIEIAGKRIPYRE